MIVLIITLLLAGLLAGTVNYFVNYIEIDFSKNEKELHQSEENPWWVHLLGYLVVGVSGALLTPLINAILENLKGISEIIDLDNEGILILFGYGLIFGYSATQLFSSLTKRIINVISNSKNLLKKSLEESENSIKSKDFVGKSYNQTSSLDNISSNGFSPSSLGLDNVTSKYGVMRDGCPHRGTDFGSSSTKKPFKAGVNGRVVEKNGGIWGTITIIPDHNKEFYIQYLHCSKINVKVGDSVTKDTIIGQTGEVGPVGRVNGIHLHLQIWKVEQPKYSCWNSNEKDILPKNILIRNFYDPETWDRG
jgi:murein DD-endopeptidase MepM/ murein hydrolase activator NlpD